MTISSTFDDKAQTATQQPIKWDVIHHKKQSPQIINSAYIYQKSQYLIASKKQLVEVSYVAYLPINQEKK